MTDIDVRTSRRTVLHDWHAAHGAKLVDFAGWDMPVQYQTGTIQEHLATRRHAGLFDVSHMGRFEITGAGAEDFLLATLTNDARALAPGQAQYSFIANEAGGAVDDAYLYKLAEARFLLVVNAGNRDTDWRWLNGHKNTGDVALTDISEDLGMIALQGPHSTAILERVVAKGELPENKRNQLSLTRFDAAELITRLRGWAGRLGLPKKTEIFPKQAAADVGNWVNVPYFGGEATNRWAWLNGEPVTLEVFLDQAEGHRTTREGLLALPLGGAPERGTERDVVKTAEAESWSARVRKVADAVARLDPERADESGDGGNPGKWIQVGLAIYHELPDDTGYELWREWSAQSDKYDADICAKKWASFADRHPTTPLTLGSLIHWAIEDAGLPPDFPDVTGLVWETTGTPGDPVTFRVTVGAHGQLEALTAGDLRSFARFDERCMEQPGLKLPEPPRAVWPGFIQTLFQVVTKDERPREGGTFGTFVDYLSEFLGRSRQTQASFEELNRGHPAVIEGRVYFQLRDLQRFLDARGFIGGAGNDLIQLQELCLLAQRFFSLNP